MRDSATNSVPVSSAVEWRPGPAVSPPAAPTLKSFDARLTIVVFFSQLAGVRLSIISDALIEATGLPPWLSRLNVMGANDNARHGVIELNHYRLNWPKNAFTGGHHG